MDLSTYRKSCYMKALTCAMIYCQSVCRVDRLSSLTHWLLSTERHLLLGNKLPGRHWSNENTVYAALFFFFASDHRCSSFQGLRQTQMLHRECLLFEGQTEAISVTSQTNERGRSHSQANKPSCPLQHLSKWDFQQWDQGTNMSFELITCWRQKSESSWKFIGCSPKTPVITESLWKIQLHQRSAFSWNEKV